MKGFSKKELLELAWEKPILAQVELTYKCNQRCLFCYSGKKTQQVSTDDLSVESWKKILRKLKNIGVRTLHFTGRENFLYPDFEVLIDWCKKSDFEIKINTNGTTDVSGVLPNVDEMIFSVHGIGQMHDEIVGKDGSFDLVEENVRKATLSGVKTSINMSLLQSNYHCMMLVFDYFDSKYDIYKFAPSIPVPSRSGCEFKDDALILNREFLRDYVDVLMQIPSDKLTLKHGFHNIFHDEKEYYEDNGLLLPSCAAGKYKLIVQRDGKVFPCNFFTDEKFYCGNILTDDEYDIWKHGEGFERFRRIVLDEVISKECTMCIKKTRCYSGCKAWATRYEMGDFGHDRDLRCKIGDAFIGS